MTTQIIGPDGQTSALSGTIFEPDAKVLSHGELTRAMISDHGDFAVFSYSSPDQFTAKINHEVRILNSERPLLDIKTEGFYIPSVMEIMYTRKEKR